jgi:hypothetical protein
MAPLFGKKDLLSEFSEAHFQDKVKAAEFIAKRYADFNAKYPTMKFMAGYRFDETGKSYFIPRLFPVVMILYQIMVGLEWRSSILLRTYSRVGSKLLEGDSDDKATGTFLGLLAQQEWADILSMVQAVKAISEALMTLTTEGEKPFDEFWNRVATDNPLLGINPEPSPENAKRFA